MEVNPLSIIFVKSDSKGDRLLFRYPYTTEFHLEKKQKRERSNVYAVNTVEEILETPRPQTSNIINGQLAGFTDEVLSTLFAVKPELCNKKFELKVNDVRFVGHPTLLPYRANKDDSSSMVLINIVFALHASASHSVVKCYYELSKRLGYALRHEEKRCAYLTEEMKIMIAVHDEISAAENESIQFDELEEESKLRHSFINGTALVEIIGQPKSPFDIILQRCTLAQSMRTVFNELSTSGIVQVRINKWVLLSFCLPHKAHQMHNASLIIEPETIDKCLLKLRPYHGMLLMVDPNDLLNSMPLDGSPALLRLIKLYSPLKSLQTIAIETDLMLNQVFQLVGHLVYWAKATIIYPLCESNVYVVAPSANVYTNSHLVTEFTKEFPGLCLMQMLSEFSLPAPLWYHAQCGRGASRLPKVVAFMLKHRLLMQIHTYVQINIYNGGKEYFCEKHSDYDKKLTDLTSIDGLQPNILTISETRANCNESYNGDTQEYHERNELSDHNQTKPIDINRHGIADSANHSYEDQDVVDGYRQAEEKTETNSSENAVNNEIKVIDEQEVNYNGVSFDSGVSNMLNGLKVTSENDSARETSSESERNDDDENGFDEVDSCLQMRANKFHHESLQPPTVVWNEGSSDCHCELDEGSTFTPREKAALEHIDHHRTDRSLLARLHSKGYFNGDKHIEEIMFMENLTRSQVMQLLEIFQDILITFETEDPAVAMLYPRY